MTQVRMKNLLRMHIHPNRKGAIRDYEVKQLFLNAKSRRFEFGLEVLKDHFLFFNLRRFVIFFFYQQDEVPGVARGILKIELKQKLVIYLAFVIHKGNIEFPH